MLEFTKEEVVGFIAVVSVIFLVGLSGKLENEYTVKGTVTDMYESNLIVTDKRGTEWLVDREFDLENIYYIGDEVKVVFDTNYTSNNFDDDKVLTIERR